VPDVGQRLKFYKALAAAVDRDQLSDIVENLADRFGDLPEAARMLIETHRLRLLCEKLGIKKVDASKDTVLLTVVPEPAFDPLLLVALMRKDGNVRMAGPERIRITKTTESAKERAQMLRGFLAKLSSDKGVPDEKRN